MSSSTSNGVCQRSTRKATKGIRVHQFVEKVEPTSGKKYKVCDKCGALYVDMPRFKI